jgi:selenocysteine lyase/cysteine desulfurase
VKLLTSRDPLQSAGIGNFSVTGIAPGVIERHLWEHHRIAAVGIVPAEFQGVRITPNIYTTIREIDTFSEAIEKLLREGPPRAA